MSALEDELAVQLRAAELEFEREHAFCAGRKWRADFVVRAKVHWALVDELDRAMNQVLVDVQGIGPQGRHGSWDHIESDCEKFSTAAALGYRALPVTGKMVRSGRALHLIEAALGLVALQDHPRATRRPKVKPKAPAAPTPSARPQAALAKLGLPSRVLEAVARGARAARGEGGR